MNKITEYYEVYVENRDSDLLEFDDLKEAVEEARKWHDESDLPIEIAKVTKEKILVVE